MAFRCSFLCLISALLLASCSLMEKRPRLSPIPTEELPTVVALTVAAKWQNQPSQTAASAVTTLLQAQFSPTTPASSPTFSATPARPSATLSPTRSVPTLFPSPAPASRTPTPSPTLAIPEAAIQIQAPGALSRLVSPFEVRAYLRPGSDGRVRLELLGEDGRLLVRKILSYLPSLTRVNLVEEVEFEISAVAETARLQISTFDRYGRPLAMDSVDVILLSMGESDVNPPGPSGEKIIIQEPLPNKLIQGGTLVVAGLARVDGKQPLLIELITAEGKLVGYRLADVAANPAGDYGTFTTEVPYQVDSPTWVRMIIKENSSGRLAGVVYLTSQEILLSP